MTIQPAHSADQAVELLKRDGELLNRYYARVLGRLATAPRRLVDAIEYSLMAGGKRLRPALILESYRAVMRQNAPDKQAPLGANETEPFPPSPLAAAGAMELIHTFSLVHDDLPAMDDDDLRRGRPTNHKVFGEAMAILAGDAMTTMAFELIATDADPSLAPALIRELARASGPEGMVGGQVLDIDGENQKLSLEQLQCLHRLKTGALLVCSCRMGAICARVSRPSSMQSR